MKITCFQGSSSLVHPWRSRKAFTSLIIRVNPMYPFLNLFIQHPSCLPKGLKQNLDRPLKIWKNASNRRVVRALCVLKNGPVNLFVYFPLHLVFDFFFYEPGTERPVRNRGVPAGIRPDFPELAGILTGTKTSPFCPGFYIGTGRSGRSGRNGTGSISLDETIKKPFLSFLNPFSFEIKKKRKHQRKMKRDHQETIGNKAESSSSSMDTGKGKSWFEDDQDAGGGMDELLAVLGYKIKSSDMADVAQKLEQLEMVLGSEDGISHLASDTVHYNPSDLSGWVQSMLSEFNNLPSTDFDSSILLSSNRDSLLGQPSALDFSRNSQSKVFTDDSEYDLRAIPGVAAFPQQEFDRSNDRKRMKLTPVGSDIAPAPAVNSLQSPTASSTSTSSPPAMAVSGNLSGPTRPVVLMDSQETGVRLVHTLLACAKETQEENLELADALVKRIGLLAASQTGAMRKVATYFAEALARRIYKISPQDYRLDSSCLDTLEMHFYETCPYLKFAHFTANQAILEAFADASRVHVIDFGLKQGMQWPALMQALALRPGGPPAFRLTGIGPPQPDNTDALQQVGWKLAQLARTIGVEFEFRGFVANSLADLDAEMLGLLPPEVEAVAVNSVFELHRLLARPGGIDKVLGSIKAMRPKIVTVVEQEANHNSPVFLDRFTEALHYYSSLFDSLEGSGMIPRSQDLVMSELYLGRHICNVVACEGADRVERHEALAQWRTRLDSAGFDPVHLGSNAFKQASMLLALFAGGDGYRVEENNGCLMLGWHTRPLIATSAWRLAAGDSQQ